MSKFEQMINLLELNNGVIRTSDIVAKGISKPYFAEFVRQQGLERVSHGIYISKDAWADPMHLLQLRFPQAIFSHGTALYMHDLTDRTPISLDVTVKTGYNTTKIRNENTRTHTVKSDLHDYGVIELPTNFGNLVKVYSKERTICDIVRQRNQLDIQIVTDALKQYSRRRDKDLYTLMNYAKTFKVERILRTYLEVLL